jgi:hypothetical protein
MGGEAGSVSEHVVAVDPLRDRGERNLFVEPFVPKHHRVHVEADYLSPDHGLLPLVVVQEYKPHEGVGADEPRKVDVGSRHPSRIAKARHERPEDTGS